MKSNWANEVIIIVAGSYSGISKAITIKAEKLGATVIVLCRTRRNHIKDFYQKGNVFIFTYDFKDTKNVPFLYKNIVNSTEKVPTIIINDMRYQVSGSVHEATLKSYEDCYNINVLFIIALLQSLIPDMVSQNKGVIANIMSAIIYHSFPGASAYYAAKSALGAIHESLSLELSGTPINTLYIRPGGFLSNYFEFSHANSRINDFEFPSKEDIKDPEYFVSKIFKAIETKKSEVNCGTLRDRIGYQLNYWAPAILHKVINYSNRNLINKIISNR